ncbi:MAG: pectate lyase [Prolixibacteraceae bacterium]|nr:pectate lyase [Prolixibacteraceae bacterium]
MIIFSNIKLFAFLMLLSVMGFAQNEATPAFPGADGHARFVTGGRGGQIIYVTHLNDDYTVGSLRTAVGASGSRIVVFKVSGTIYLKSELKINNSNITIAGQTAPGDGITLAGYPVSVGADNVIIRFMRFRMGDSGGEGDALGGRFKKNIMIDHCSMSWSTDETVSFYQNETFTMQWCIISESLRNSVHDKGSHGYGGIWGGKNASFHHNLLAHHDSRNPRLGEYNGDPFALTDAVDLRNNVVYNWQGNSCYGGEAMNVNIVNCYYKPGPATSKIERIVSIDYEKEADKATYKMWGKFYIDGNVLEASERATNDNWTYGVYNQFHGSYGFVSAEDKAEMKIEKPHPTGYVHTHSAEMAFEKVVDYAGASFVRDTVDKRVIHDVRTGTATFMDGGNGSVNGIIDTQEAVGGWPELTSTEAPADTDEDGMPDEWETANGLDSNDKNDAWKNSLDEQYPNVEVYLNSLVQHIIDAQIEDAELIFVDESTSSGKSIASPGLYRAFYHPTSQSIIVNGDRSIKRVEVFSLSGSLIESVNPSRKRVEISMAGCDSSLFIVRVTDENNLAQTKNVVAF